MTFLLHLFLLIHLLGYGALFGGLLVQVKEPVKKVNGAMRDGIGTAVVAGLVLTGIVEGKYHPGGEFHGWLSVKLIVGLVILGLVMANLRKPSIPQGLYFGLIGLTVINLGVATLWHQGG
ncbi:hypothetical protein [Nocardioides sp. Kera G14]|uniref:hypothetical protein n=1 Tax=Nocardioides sp. Kera G14 TaxID=2884264 RepID=UPI001D125041|nr:hypothetical protein [Nocardioides sp. Kera G14]UDY24365.1 hypothetical protein LH076_03415 [Nocardioides sp. Kera G14]